VSPVVELIGGPEDGRDVTMADVPDVFSVRRQAMGYDRETKVATPVPLEWIAQYSTSRPSWFLTEPPKHRVTMWFCGEYLFRPPPQ